MIAAEGLGKRYRLGIRRSGYSSLRESMVSGVRSGRRLFSRRRGPTPEDREFWALREVNFSVQEGEVLGVVGRNGAGKSTLLKLLSDITEPTEGRITLRGRVASLLEVGTGFHPELSGRENIYLNGAILGMARSEIQRKFDEIVAFAEVERFIDTQVKRYSSGMYLRLAFSVAAHLEPEILLVDEVLAVGDAQFQQKCMGKMGEVSRGGRTVLFVSHNLAAIRRLCPRSLLLQSGRVAAIGNTSSILDRYLEEGDSQQTEFQLGPGQIVDPTGRATRMLLQSELGAPCNSFPVADPWQVQVEFTLDQPVSQFTIALAVQSADHVWLRTSWSPPQNMEAGHYIASIREDIVMLGAGQYSLTVGLASQGQSFYYIEKAGTLIIAPFSTRLAAPSFTGAGIMNPFSFNISKAQEL